MSASRENVRYFINYCWFTRDVTAAMLVVCWWSEQSIFLLWEPYPTFMKILRQKILFYWPPTHIQHGRLVTWLQTKKMLRWFILYLQTNDDDENKGKSQKKNWFMSKTTSLHVHLVFWYIPWRHCTTPDATFYGGRLYTTTNFPFSFWSWIKFVRIQLQKKAPTFNKLKGSK